MDGDRLETARRESEIESWHGRNTLGEGLFVWRHALRGGEIPGGALYLDQRVELPPPSVLDAMAAAAPEEGTPAELAPVLRLTQSLWHLSDDPQGPALRVDVYECTSRAAAHDMVLRLLGQVQTTPLSRREDLGVGDVAFASPGETSLLFARANLAVVVSNAGRTLVPVQEMARAFDVDLVRKPEPPPGPGLAGLAAEAEPAEAPRLRARVGEAVPIDLGELEPTLEAAHGTASLALEAEAAGPPPTLKLFYGQGEVAWEGGRLVYRPTTLGRQEVEVYTVDPAGPASRRSLQVEVE